MLLTSNTRSIASYIIVLNMLYRTSLFLLLWIFLPAAFAQTSIDACSNFTRVDNYYTRSINYTKQPWDLEECESQNTTAGWYGFVYGENIPTYAPAPYQCGTLSPIWFDGSYPTNYGEEKNVTACLVSVWSTCQESWDVTVKNCGGYNIAYLEPVDYCGTYCMDSNGYQPTPSPSGWTYNDTSDPCYYHMVSPNDYTRSPGWTLSPGDVEICDNITEGWYRYEYNEYVPTFPVQSGQCGSSNPIWFQGTYPTYDKVAEMTACMAGEYSNCEDSWTVKVKNCYDMYNVAYLKPLSKCGRFCKGNSSDPYGYNPSPSPSDWSYNYSSDPCMQAFYSLSDYDRAPEWRLTPGEDEKCDNITEGWYGYMNYENIPTSPMQAGQCGSSRPIWLQGTYPKNNGETEMTACMANEYYDCADSWTVKVKNCYDMYNVAYLKPLDDCARICKESDNSSGPHIYNPSPSPSGWTFNDTSDPCMNHFISQSDNDRIPEWTLMPGESEMCDNITEGWYRYEYYENVPTYPIESGHCRSSSPIWFQGTYPIMSMEKEMTACMAGEYSTCDDSWTVKVKNCYDMYNVAYLKPLSKCGRMCKDSNGYQPTPSPSGWTYNDTSDPCYYHMVSPNDYTRSPGWTLSPGDVEICDNITEGWYRYEYNEYVPTFPVQSGQCGSSNPIWFQGTYPTYDKVAEMTACMAGEYSNCEDSWTVKVKNCYDMYNVAYLKPPSKCGRFCKGNSSDPYGYNPSPSPSDWSYNYSSDPCMQAFYSLSDYDRAPEWRLTPGEDEKCDNITEGWYGYMNYENIPTSPMQAGQCGSSRPIWLQGTYPKNNGETEMTACMANEYYDCADSWTVKVKNCYDMYNVAYLKPLDDCARICKESDNSSGPHIYNPSPSSSGWTFNDTSDPCMNHFISQSDNDRIPEWTLMPGESEMCDNITEGWYRYEYYENVPTYPIESGHCRSSSPIWFQGTYPIMSMEKEMTACMAGEYSTCDDSWTVKVKNCYDMYNVAYLKPLSKCGRMCKDSNGYQPTPSPSGWTYNDTSDPCYYHMVSPNDYTRSPGWTLSPGDVEICDNITEGWYRYEYNEYVPTFPVQSGQCGSSNPIWFQGTYPNYDKVAEMTACMAGEYSNCEDSWTVKVKNCYDMYNVAYLKPPSKCGRFCKGNSSDPYGYNPSPSPSDWSYNYSSDPCMQAFYSLSDYDRAPEWRLTPGEDEKCDNITEGWYGYMNYENIPTSPMQAGQCGSSRPIWLQGTYPKNNGETELTACMANEYYDCADSWTVKVKNCYDMYNVAYLKPLDDCARICKESDNSSGHHIYNPSPSPSGWTFNDTSDPCMNHFISQSDNDRIPEWTLMPGESEMCDNITEGWYRYEYYENVPTYPIESGHCRSSNPVWFQGTYPTYNGESEMTACMAGRYSSCDDSWTVKVKNCYGMFNMAYLKPLSKCGRMCKESGNSSDYNPNPSPTGWNFNYTSDPCMNHFISPSDYDRSPEWRLMPGESEMCDNITEGWYRYEYYEKVPTYPLQSGQCRSKRPIWFQGTYPKSDGEKEMTACMVGESSDCQDSWPVKVKNCYDMFNVAYLKPLTGCGRICIEGNITTRQTDYPEMPSGGYTELPDISMPPDGYTEEHQDWSMPQEGNTNSYPTQGYTDGYPDRSMPPQGYTDGYPDMTMPPDGYTGKEYTNYPDMSMPPETPDRTMPPGGYTNYPDMSMPQEGYTNSYPDRSMQPEDYTDRYPDRSMPPEGYTNSFPDRSMPPQGYTDGYPDMSMPPEGYTDGYPDRSMPPEGYTGGYPDWSMPSEGYTDGYPDRSMPPQGYTDGHPDMTMPLNGYTGKEYTNYPDMSMPPETPDRTMPPGGYTNYPDMSMPQSDDRDDTLMATPASVDPCLNNTIILSENNRLSSSTLNATEIEKCDTIYEGWYRYSGGQKVPSSAPSVGGCKSNAPIWFDGTYPSDGMETTMKFCMVGSTSSCEHEQMIEVKNCGSFYTAFLRPLSKCGRFCMELPDISMPPDGYTEEHQDWSMPQEGNTNSYPTQGYTDGYPNRSMPPQGYTDGYPDMTMPPDGYTGKEYTNYPDMSMPPETPDRTMPPGGYTNYPDMSMPQSDDRDDTLMTTPASVDPCLNNTIILSENNRLSSSTLNATEIEKCDTIYEGWYRYSGGQKVPSSAPSVGGCKSNAPIWFDGTYPSDGMETTMKFCMVGSTSSCEHEQMIEVKNCGSFYTAFLRPLSKCGRFCMESGFPTLDELKTQYEISVEPVVPSLTPNSDDNQLMFTCKHREKIAGAVSLDGYRLDIKWEIDSNEVVVKENIAVADKDTSGRLKSTEWNSQPKKMGFNVKCSIKLHGTTDYMISEEFFAGMQVNSNDITVSSGAVAEIYYKSTVPVACITSSECKLAVELVDFTEEYTSGSPQYCSSTFTDLTKPSLCGLDLNGWFTGQWQKLDVKLPANVANDQEYRAKMKLRVVNSQYDTLWSNYDLPEVTINVVNSNTTEDYWWSSDCFTGSDPWYFTYDWEWFGFHDEGEFALFKHKTKPLEVHTIQRRYSSSDSWTEHCAVAIRAASDVFILYGCGRPTKWVQRRIGCSTGKEYLEVYERWGEYEVVLPTGTRVNVWIASNRMLNIYITLSKADRNNIEGLCGNGNGIWSDDFTGKDGVLYTDSLSFARTYRVPSSESLFIKSSRQTKLAQSKLYCSCSGVSRTEQTSNEDCSWKDTVPVCPPTNWNRKACSVRTKRSTDGSSEDDDDIDYTPVHKEHVDTTMVWKNGWNETAAKAACDDYFSKSALYSGCAEISNVNSTSSKELCVLNIRVSGGDEFLQDGLKMMTTQCTSEIRTNNEVYSQQSSSGGQTLGELIKNSDCPNECKHGGVKKGSCVNGQCSCDSGRAGKDCSGDKTKPPQPEKEITQESFCQKCTKMSVYATNIYSETPMCKIYEAEEVNGELVPSGNGTPVQGTLEGMGSVECPLPTSSRRKKRSTDTSSSVNYYQISVSNDGSSYSDTVPVISYDSSCYVCTNTNSTVSCQLRSDICVVNGVCYSTSHSSCSTDDDSSSSKAWIAGVAIGLLFIVIIVVVVLVYKFKVLKFKSKMGRSVSPELPLEFTDKYQIWDEPGTSMPPVDTTTLYGKS